MTMRLKLPQVGKEIELRDGKTLLEAALEQGVSFPHSCGRGRCGACKSSVLRGSVSMLAPYSRFALSADELRQGLVLACRAKAFGDVELAWLNDDQERGSQFKKFRATVVALERPTSDIVRLFLQPDLPEPVEFHAGQFAMLGIAGLPARSYSMASLPGQQVLEFHVRVAPGGRVSSYAYHQLQVGECVEVQGPLGAANLRDDHVGPIVAVAGGSGLAPMKSICEAALRSQPDREIRLYHGARTASDLYLEDLFRQWESEYRNFRFIPVLSLEPKRTVYRTGQVGDVVAEELTSVQSVKFYTAGPPVLVEYLASLLQNKGVNAEDVHADPFYTLVLMAQEDEGGV